MCLMFVKCFKRMTFLDLIGQWWASGPVQPVSSLSQIHAGARKPSRLAHKTTPLFQARPSLFSFPNFPAQSKDLQHSSIMHREKKTREGGVRVENPIVAPCHTQITRGSMERTIDGGTVFLFLFNRQKKNKGTGELFLVVFFGPAGRANRSALKRQLSVSIVYSLAYATRWLTRKQTVRFATSGVARHHRDSTQQHEPGTRAHADILVPSSRRCCC